MGSDEIKDPTLKVIVIGGDDQILEHIFPQEIKNDTFKAKSNELSIPYKCRKFTKKIDKLKTEIIWEAFLIEDLTDSNYDRCLELISIMLDLEMEDYDEKDSSETNKIIKIKKEKSKFDRKYIVIKFGTANLSSLLYMLGEQSRIYLPQIAVVSDTLLDEDCSQILYDNRFLTLIQKNDADLKKTIINIFSYLWDRESYYNERGNLLNDYTPSKIMKIDEKIQNYINILVVGISRSGKSTLINLLSRKLVSLESPEPKSITRKITEYLLERTIDGQERKIGIKLIDTPGLKKLKENGKNIDFTKIVIELINKKMKECEDSKDDIHMIYFVFGNNPNLEDNIEFFQFLKKLNEKRIEKKKKKIPIIFIGNNNIGKEGVDGLSK